MSRQEVKVTLMYLREEEKMRISFEGTSLRELVIDLSKVTGGEARALTAASALECMSSWILHFLRRHEEDLGLFQAVATTNIMSDAEGDRVSKITVKIHLKVLGDENKRERYEKIIRKIVEKGCLMSRSLKKGIVVEYVPIVESVEEGKKHNKKA